jgi:hypothetical protein
MYKDFSVYANGLYYISNENNQKLLKKHNIKFRIYIDNSLSTIVDKKFNKVMTKLKQYENFQIIEFNCPDHKKNDLYHKGFFASLFRYYPIHNFSDNDTRYVFILDIDISENKIKNNEYFSYLINTFVKYRDMDIDLLYLDSLCYYPFWKEQMMLKYDSIVIGGYTFGKYKFDKNILLNFLKNIDKRENSQNVFIKMFYINYDKYINKYKKTRQHNDKFLKKYNSYKTDKIHLYGYDELYLTYFLFVRALKSNIKIHQFAKNASHGGIVALLTLFFDPLLRKSEVIDKNSFKMYTELLTKMSSLVKHLIENKTYNEEYSPIINEFLMVNNKNIIKKMEAFIQLFVKHNYEGGILQVIYETFHKKMMYLIKKKIKGYDEKKYICFKKNNIYYTDKNNIIRLSQKHKKEKYSNYIYDKKKL